MIRRLLLTLFFPLFLFAGESGFLHDYQKALQEAQLQHKAVYMLITSQTCRWCKKFEEQTLSDKDTIDALKKEFVLLHLDRDNDTFPKTYDTKRIPRHYFITSKGEVIYTFLGYWNVENFNAFLYDIQTNYLQKFKGKNK